MKFSLSAAMLAVALLASACSTATRTVAPISAAEVGEVRAGSGYLKGYLAPAELPDSLALLPPPPAEGSAALAADAATFRTLTALQGTPRGALAVQDANLRFPKAAETFSCALGLPISEEATPNLNMLLRRTLTDAGIATYKAKDKYQRTRPFVVFKAPSCTPREEAALAKDGSYPSGHSAAGWAWAMVLTEVAPERSDALLQRGRAFSQSRGICGVHWQSDIEAGRLIGAATVARLHANPVFNAQVDAARLEVARARAQGSTPGRDCAAEAAALGSSSMLAP
ncbi:MULTISPECIES: acid phosphatase [Polaromonas]|uniref:Acid phosphatase n=1 Tax=Polaromonas aquatica TaxID=332657 RepID=A0ABW1U2S8_9BURK